MATAWYVALGDSMSIDLYPRLELIAQGSLDPSEAPGIGAASLFHRNHDGLWPAFTGRDLSARIAGIEKHDGCVDGATIGHTRDYQLPLVPAEVREGTAVVTLTAGGNDLLASLFEGLPAVGRAVERAVAGYEELVDQLLQAFPAAVLMLTTVYDPTDGSGHLPGLAEDLGELPIHHLATFNDAVRATADGIERARLADVHAHFLGHGLTGAGDERWYWDPSPIEPGARGASEIRRVWLDALPEDLSGR